MDVDLKIRLLNETGAGLKAAVSGAEKAAQKIGTASERASAKATEAAEKGAARSRSSHEKMARAREVLEVRSSQTIQHEIARVKSVYTDLKSSGTMSWREQAAAADSMRSKVRGLTNEMGKLTTAQKAMGAAKGAFAIGAGTLAAGYALKAPAMEAMSYDYRLAHMANTAYNERDRNGRKMGKKTLEDAIDQAVDAGGGTREDAAAALDAMVASGVMKPDAAMKMLPEIVKAAKAANTNASDMAMIGVRGVQGFGMKPEQISAMLSAAMVAGQEGGFEVNSMARFLPEQMALAKNIGMQGKDDFVELLAMNQASVITAGGEGQAGTNVKDLLKTLNTPHFKRYLSEELHGGVKAKSGEKVKRGKEIDSLYLDYQARGIGKARATLDITRKLIGRDKKYQALREELKNAGNNEDKERILQAMTAQMEGSKIGKLFHNQESLLGFLSILNNDAYTKKVIGRSGDEFNKKKGDLETSVSHDVVMDTPAAKLERAAEALKRGEKAAMDNLTPSIGKAAEAFSDLAQKHPELAGGIVLGTKAITAFALAAGASSLLMGGKAVAGGGVLNKATTLLSRAGGSIAAAATGAVGAVSAASASLAAGTAGAGALAAGAAGVAGAGAVGYGVGTGINWAGENLAKGTRMEGWGTDVIGGGIAKTLAFFGNTDAREAVERTERLRLMDRADREGQNIAARSAPPERLTEPATARLSYMEKPEEDTATMRYANRTQNSTSERAPDPIQNRATALYASEPVVGARRAVPLRINVPTRIPEEGSAITRYASSALNGAGMGAAMGAAMGSVVPVLGTAVGGAVGGSLGLLYEGFKSWFGKNDEKNKVDVNAKMTIGLAPGLVLQNQSMQANGAAVQMDTGNVWMTP